VRFDSPFIDAGSIRKGIRTILQQADVDTVIVACTQMHAAGCIADIEAETGKTILSSNQALCWHALRLAGCNDAIEGWGRLFRSPA